MDFEALKLGKGSSGAGNDEEKVLSHSKEVEVAYTWPQEYFKAAAET